MAVAVLIPVLNRPHLIAPLVANLLATSPDDTLILFLASEGDDAEIRELEKADDAAFNVGIYPPSGQYAAKINKGFQLARLLGCDWIFQAADDLRFHPGWAEAALAAHRRRGARVIGTQDLCNPSVKKGQHSTHTLIHTSYIEEQGASWDGPGGVLHEGYDHQAVDSELVRVAMERGEWAFANDSVVEHLHWICGKGERDATAEKAFAKGREDIRLYRERLAKYGRKLP